MRATAIIIADAGHERFRTALILAMAQAALGSAVRLFFQGDALSLLRPPICDPDEARQTAAGLPGLALMIEEALSTGITFTACQSSLSVLGAIATDFDGRVEWGGMIGFMSSLKPDERLIVA